MSSFTRSYPVLAVFLVFTLLLPGLVPASAGAAGAATAAASQLSLGKSVDKPTISAPDTLSYTLTPGYSGAELLENAKVLDPLPAGATFVNAGQGGSLGAYLPQAAVDGVDDDTIAPDTTVSLSASPTTVA